MRTRSAVALAGSIAALACLPHPTRADDAASLRSLLAAHSPAIVNVKIVLKTQMNAGGTSETNESEADTQGVVVSSDGLVLLSSSSFSSDAMEQMLGGPDTSGGADPSQQFGMKTTPTSFKVSFGNEEKTYDAFLAASDKLLNLSFIKISDLAGRKIAVEDLSQSGEPAVGDRVVGISRLSRGYDFTPYFKTALVSGETNIPRHAYLLDSSVGAMGLPVYSLQGTPLGVLTMLPPTVKPSLGGEEGMGMFFAMLSGGGFGALFQEFIIPCDAVRADIAMAAARASKLQAGNPAPAGAAPAKPAAPRPAGK